MNLFKYNRSSFRKNNWFKPIVKVAQPLFPVLRKWISGKFNVLLSLVLLLGGLIKTIATGNFLTYSLSLEFSLILIGNSTHLISFLFLSFSLNDFALIFMRLNSLNFLKFELWMKKNLQIQKTFHLLCQRTIKL